MEREGGRERGRKRRGRGRGRGGAGHAGSCGQRRVLLLLSTVIHLPAASLLSLSLSQEPKDTSAQTPALPAAPLPGDSLPRLEVAQARSDPARVSPPAVREPCLHLSPSLNQGPRGFRTTSNRVPRKEWVPPTPAPPPSPSCSFLLTPPPHPRACKTAPLASHSEPRPPGQSGTPKTALAPPSPAPPNSRLVRVAAAWGLDTARASMLSPLQRAG